MTYFLARSNYATKVLILHIYENEVIVNSLEVVTVRGLEVDWYSKQNE